MRIIDDLVQILSLIIKDASYNISCGVKSALKNTSRYLRITEIIPHVVRLTDSAYVFRMWLVMAERCIFRVAIKGCSRG